MATLAYLDSQISVQLTPSGGADKVSAAELRAVAAIIKTLFQERGVLLLDSTADLATTPSTESLFAYVNDEGFFAYSPTGVPDNVDIFPAPNGGVWSRKVSGGGGSGSADSDIDAIANLNPSNDDIIQRKGGAWVNRNMAQVKIDLALNNVPNVDTTNPANIQQATSYRFVTDIEKAAWNAKQAGSIELSALAAIAAANNDFIQRKAGAWVNRTPAQVKADLTLTSSDVGLGNVNNTADADKPLSIAAVNEFKAKGIVFASIPSDLNLISTTITDTVYVENYGIFRATNVGPANDLNIFSSSNGQFWKQMKYLERTPLLNTAAPNVTIDAEISSFHKILMTSDVIIDAPINGREAQRICIEIKQGGAGGFVPTWAAGYAFSDTFPVPDDVNYSAAPNARDKFVFERNNYEDTWDCVGQIYNIG